MAKESKIIVRGVRRAEPDIERLARALLQYALAAEDTSTSEPEKEAPAPTQETAS